MIWHFCVVEGSGEPGVSGFRWHDGNGASLCLVEGVSSVMLRNKQVQLKGGEDGSFRIMDDDIYEDDVVCVRVLSPTGWDPLNETEASYRIVGCFSDLECCMSCVSSLSALRVLPAMHRGPPLGTSPSLPFLTPVPAAALVQGWSCA